MELIALVTLLTFSPCEVHGTDMLTLSGKVGSPKLVVASAAHALGVVFPVCVLAIVNLEIFIFRRILGWRVCEILFYRRFRLNILNHRISLENRLNLAVALEIKMELCFLFYTFLRVGWCTYGWSWQNFEWELDVLISCKHFLVILVNWLFIKF